MLFSLAKVINNDFNFQFHTQTTMAIERLLCVGFSFSSHVFDKYNVVNIMEKWNDRR